MTSRTIFDTPDLLDETLVALNVACKCFPVACSRSALERWIRRNRDIALESVLVCGKRYTSKEAIDRFVRNQLRTEPERSVPKRGNKSKKEIEEASRKFGLPEPQKSGNDGACQSLLEMVVNIDCPNAKKSTQPLTKER